MMDEWPELLHGLGAARASWILAGPWEVQGPQSWNRLGNGNRGTGAHAHVRRVRVVLTSLLSLASALLLLPSGGGLALGPLHEVSVCAELSELGGTGPGSSLLPLETGLLPCAQGRG